MHGNTKLLDRIQFLGYCCPREFFRTHSSFTNEDLGELLGLKPRTIRFWKSKAKSQSLCKTCFNL